MLKRLQVSGFKSLENVELRALDRVVVLFGPNAAGKSNLLEAITLLSRIVGQRTLAEAFGPPLRGYPHEAFMLPDTGLEGLLSLERASLCIEADVDAPEPKPGGRPRSLRYRVGVDIAPSTGKLSLAQEHLQALKQDGTVREREAPRLAVVDDGESRKLVVRRKGEAGRPRHEDLGGPFAHASNLQLTGRLHPELDALRRELAAWRSYYLDPRTAMRSEQPPREVDDMTPTGELLAPLLHRLKSERDKAFRAVERTLRQAVPGVDGLDVDLDKKRGSLDIVVRQDGTPFSCRVLSEGTLRILALCVMAATPWSGRLVTFEEPENGVHPRRIDLFASLLVNLARNGGPQVIVTSHSPRFVSSMLRLQREGQPVKVLACRRRARRTEFVEFGAAGRLFSDGMEEVRDALSSDEDAVLEATLNRGWLDG